MGNGRTAELAEVEARMVPGRFSERGFLGPGERLGDLLAADAATLTDLGLSAEELVAPLDYLLTEAKASRRRRARLGRVTVHVEVFRGFQVCPWSPDPPQQCLAGGGVTHASLDWHLRHGQTGEVASGPGLAVHLIRAHGFFGGRGTPYRVDPNQLALLFSLSG